MPRKHKGGKNRRESSGKRWKRNRAAQARYRALGTDPRNPNHQRIELDSMEFACLFTVIGGRDPIGPGIVRAFDAHGQKPGQAVAPNLLQIGRDKASKLMARARDAAAIRQIREDQREEGKQMQVNRLMAAVDRDAFGWYRQEVPDQKLRSVLCGSNNGKDPTRESDSLVVCFKADDGRYHIAEETWDGSWSAPDADGYRERVGVNLDSLPITFHDEHEAQRALIFAAKAGELERFADREDATHMHRIAARLRVWEHQGQDRKQIYG